MEQNRRPRLHRLLIADRYRDSGSIVALVCARCVMELSVTGASATVLSHLHNGSDGATHPSRGLVHATNPTSAALGDLQLTIGEGPCLDAFGSGGSVLVADLTAEGAHWPAFTPGALALAPRRVTSSKRSTRSIRRTPRQSVGHARGSPMLSPVPGTGSINTAKRSMNAQQRMAMRRQAPCITRGLLSAFPVASPSTLALSIFRGRGSRQRESTRRVADAELFPGDALKVWFRATTGIRIALTG
ncbi:hypothetical protein SAMN05216188_11942 [Lentzea xinjiangensis]|uniref:Uncharacterized protein n=1 Tax=Lentzea xinjiangensis TaxID=402600 RepID=A0A1H9TS02_9PSEU|nr:hypothetical protein SAMN05216188_11942 [Lentzea xinjiangensis]